jgi:hypothetical protein
MIKLTPEFVTEALQGKASVFPSNLPDDIELLDIRYDLFTKQITAIVRSDRFEDLVDAYPIPEFKITFSAVPKTSLSTTPTPKTETKTVAFGPKTEPKPMATIKPEPAPPKKTSVPPKQNISLLEEEFSQDQRKLLSFSINGDYVIVKPVKFLKAEWDEINEVVRSIGGRWVKGDIISYWEIPQQKN